MLGISRQANIEQLLRHCSVSGKFQCSSTWEWVVKAEVTPEMQLVNTWSMQRSWKLSEELKENKFQGKEKKKKKRRVLQLFVRVGCGSGLPSALRPFAATSRAAAPRRGLPAPRCPAGTQAAAAAKQCHKSYCKCYMIQIVLYHSMSHITTPMQWVSEVKRKPVLTIFIFCNFIQTVLVWGGGVL